MGCSPVSWCPFGGRCVLGVSFTSPGFDKAQGSRAPVEWRLESQQAVLALAGKGTLLFFPGTLPARLQVGRQGQSRTRWRPPAGPYRQQPPGGRSSGALLYNLAQLLRGSPRWVCSPVLVWASGPLHCAMLGATGTSPDQGGGSWPAMFPPGLPGRLGRPECVEREGRLQAAPGLWVRSLHWRFAPAGGHRAQKSIQPAGPGRAGQASEPEGWRPPVSQDGMCRMWVGTWLRPTTCPGPVHLLGPSVSPS